MPNGEKASHIGLRKYVHEIIFEADTPGGKTFDIILIWSIILSIIAVLLDSVKVIRVQYGDILLGVEWFFTLLFTVEYLLRLWCVGRPLRYAGSFFGIIDLLAVAPTYLSLLFPGTQYFIVIRFLRVLRVFRVLKLAEYIGEGQQLIKALKSSQRKIFLFLFTVLTLVTILGSLMYLVEGGRNGFTSIPRSIYWAIVTLTTVGYGDISPKTVLGQTVASFVMILGYSIIAVPTGIVTAEMTRQVTAESLSTQACSHCMAEGHLSDAKFCRKCGEPL